MSQITETLKNASKNRRLVVFVIVLLLYWTIRKSIAKAVQEEEYNQLGSSQNAQIAFRIRQACSPLSSFLGKSVIDFDGTDENALFQIATEIRDYNGVKDSYFRLYGESLTQRLEAELGSDFVRFNQIVAENQTKPAVPPAPPIGAKVYARVPLRLKDAATLEFDIDSYKAGEYIGTYLGRTVINGVPHTIVNVTKLFIFNSKNLVVTSQITIK